MFTYIKYTIKMLPLSYFLIGDWLLSSSWLWFWAVANETDLRHCSSLGPVMAKAWLGCLGACSCCSAAQGFAW